MARAKPPKPSAEPAAVALALRLREAMLGDRDYAADDVPAETGGVLEKGAMFHLTDAAGHVWRVRVNRTR